MFWRKRHTITREAIREGLAESGIGRGDLLVLHSSLSSLGWVDGGAEALVEAVLDVLGPEGTLMAPSFTHCFAPRDGRDRARQGPFDRASTSSATGRVAEAVRLHPAAHRSDHPIHSAAAVGRLAEQLTAGHALSSDFGPESPFGRSLRLNGTILLIGVSQNVNSTLHAVEDLLDMPYLVTEKALVRGGDGRPELFTCRKCPIGDRDFYRPDESKWNRAIQRTGVVRHGSLGRARTQIMKSSSLAQAALELLRAEPDLLLCDRPACRFCTWAREQLGRLGFRDPLEEA